MTFCKVTEMQKEATVLGSIFGAKTRLSKMPVCNADFFTVLYCTVKKNKN